MVISVYELKSQRFDPSDVDIRKQTNAPTNTPKLHPKLMCKRSFEGHQPRYLIAVIMNSEFSGLLLCNHSIVH